MNIKDEDNNNLIKVRKNGILYFVTDYFDKENILNQTILDLGKFYLKFKNSEESRRYTV